MSKKSKRGRVGRQARESTPTAEAIEAHLRSLSPSATGTLPRESGAQAKAEESARYRHVMSDLRRIALIAGPMILLLITLYFFLR